MKYAGLLKALKVLKQDMKENPQKNNFDTDRILRKINKHYKDITSALSLLEGASEWWACPGADIITKEPPDKEDCHTCVKRSCPGPVKYLIAKGGK